MNAGQISFKCFFRSMFKIIIPERFNNLEKILQKKSRKDPGLIFLKYLFIRDLQSIYPAILSIHPNYHRQLIVPALAMSAYLKH